MQNSLVYTFDSSTRNIRSLISKYRFTRSSDPVFGSNYSFALFQFAHENTSLNSLILAPKLGSCELILNHILSCGSVRLYLIHLRQEERKGSRPRGSPIREGDEGVRRILGPIFRTFVPSRSRFSNFSSAPGPIFKFLSVLGHNFFICPL